MTIVAILLPCMLLFVLTRNMFINGSGREALRGEARALLIVFAALVLVAAAVFGFLAAYYLALAGSVTLGIAVLTDRHLSFARAALPA